MSGDATGLAAVLDVDGPAAPPRSNGELVFNAPWESRAFGLALAMHSKCVFEWEEVRPQLIAAVAEWERTGEGEWNYYRCCLTALERVLAEHGVIAEDDVDQRTVEFAGRHAGHDHDH